MREMNNSPKDPYRSPHEVADSKSAAKKWGWKKFALFAFALLSLATLGMAVFSTTTTFNIQRARPIEIEAQQAVESGTRKLEEGSSGEWGDMRSDAESTQNP